MLEIATCMFSDTSAAYNFFNYPYLRNLIWSSSYIFIPIDPQKSKIELLRYLVKRFATIKNRFWISEFEDSLTIGEQTILIRYQHLNTIITEKPFTWSSATNLIARLLQLLDTPPIAFYSKLHDLIIIYILHSDVHIVGYRGHLTFSSTVSRFLTW